MANIVYGIEAKLVDNASKAIERIEGKLTDQLGTLKNMAIGYFGVTEMVNLLKTGFDNLVEAEDQTARVSSAIKNLKTDTGETLDKVIDFSDELQRLYGIDNDVITGIQATGIQFGITGDALKRATDISIDAASAMRGVNATGEDMEGIMWGIGRALQDPEEGLGRLSRTLGITFTDSQKDAITAMIEMGDTAKAQEYILLSLEQKYKGTAEEITNTTGGMARSVKTWWDNLLEDMMGSFKSFSVKLLDLWNTTFGKDRMKLSDKTTAEWQARLKKEHEDELALEEKKEQDKLKNKEKAAKDLLKLETDYAGKSEAEKEKARKAEANRIKKAEEDERKRQEELDKDRDKRNKIELTNLKGQQEKLNQTYYTFETQRNEKEIELLESSQYNVGIKEEEKTNLLNQAEQKRTELRNNQIKIASDFFQAKWRDDLDFFGNIAENMKQMLKKMLIAHIDGLEQRIIAESAAGIVSAVASKDYGRAAQITAGVATQMTVLEGAKAAVAGLETGGIVQGEGIYRIGERNKKEAVIPLESSSGKRILNNIAKGTENQSINNNQNITLEIDGIKLATIMNKKTIQAKRLGIIN